MAQTSRVAYLMATASLTASAPVGTPATFTRINGPLDDPFTAAIAGSFEGWSVDSASAISNDTAFTVFRQGYTTTGSTTSYMETMYVRRKVRQPYSNQASPSASTYALSDYLYSTDTVSGSPTPNSTVVSPKPVANWAAPDRRLIGNSIGGSSLPVEVTAFHRDFRNQSPVACVIFTISDGTNPDITVTVSTPTVSGQAWDLNPVIVYALPSTDITSLATGKITVNAKVYPWIGAAASVNDSSANSARRDFSPRYFWKNATKFATPDIMYVDASLGNDTTAEVNNSSLPAATIVGAINRMRTGSSGAPWSLNTTQIVVKADGTYSISASGSGTTTGGVAGLMITRDTGSTTKAGVILQGGLSNFAPNLGAGGVTPTQPALIMKDLTLTRLGGTSFLFNCANIEIQLDNVAFNGNNQGSNLFSNSVSGQGLYLYGVTITNIATGGFNNVAQVQQRIWRGVSVTNPGNTGISYLIGCNIVSQSSGYFAETTSGATADNQIIAFNKFNNITTTSMWAVSTTVTAGLAIVQNVFEYNSASGGNMVNVSNDSQTNNTSHVIIWCNTYIGFYNQGRTNLFYDEGVTPRLNKLMSVVGNIFSQLNTKGDVFRGLNEAGADASTRLGNWSFLYGVGCSGNWTQYIDANNGGLGTSFAQAYNGPGSSYGTSTTVPKMATSFFTNYLGPTSGVAGAGNGTYSIGTNGSGLNIVPNAPLPYDLAGTARNATNDTAGAYFRAA